MDVNENTWNTEVGTGLVLVDFWATWCPPCNQLTPVLVALAEKNADKIKIVKMNIEENDETPQRYQVSVLPTLIFFKDGEPIKTVVGLQSEAQLQGIIDVLAST